MACASAEDQDDASGRIAARGRGAATADRGRAGRTAVRRTTKGGRRTATPRFLGGGATRRTASGRTTASGVVIVATTRTGRWVTVRAAAGGATGLPVVE